MQLLNCHEFIQIHSNTLADYINHRLNLSNHVYSTLTRKIVCQKHDNPKLSEVMRRLALDFEQKYRDSYQSEWTDIPLNHALATDTRDAQTSFEAVASELFQGGWKWPRVVAMISYSGLLAEATVARASEHVDVEKRLEDIISWTIEIFRSDDAKAFFDVNGWVIKPFIKSLVKDKLFTIHRMHF